MMSRSILHGACALAAVVLAGACGSGVLGNDTLTGVTTGGGGSVGTSANYTGEIGDSLKHGTISITVSPSLGVTGSLTFAGGPTIPVTGTLDTAAAAMHASGSGYTISASANAGTLGGSYTGPGVNGFLVATSDSLTGMTHNTYCGVYTSTNSNGRFTMQVLSSGDAGGFVVQTSGTAVSSFFSGTVISNTTLTAVTNFGIGISGSVSADLSTITGSYAPPVAGSSTPGAATGQFSATTGGC
jgi:hypothetical protein